MHSKIMEAAIGEELSEKYNDLDITTLDLIEDTEEELVRRGLHITHVSLIKRLLEGEKSFNTHIVPNSRISLYFSEFLRDYIPLCETLEDIKNIDSVCSYVESGGYMPFSTWNSEITLKYKNMCPRLVKLSPTGEGAMFVTSILGNLK